MRHYILVNKQPVLVDLLEWARWFGFNKGLNRVVAQERVGGTQILVSTVFLGVDHGFGTEGAPVLFETMIFGGAFDEFQQRYCTYAEAEEGHKAAVAKVEAAIKGLKQVELEKIFNEAKKKYKKTLKKLSE